MLILEQSPCKKAFKTSRLGSIRSPNLPSVRAGPELWFPLIFHFRFKTLNDENSSHLLYFNCALRWFALRMDVLMNIVTFVVALLVTLSFSSISASSKGLSLSYIIQVTLVHGGT